MQLHPPLVKEQVQQQQKSKGKKVSMNQNSNFNVDYKPRVCTNLIGSMEKFWPSQMLRKKHIANLDKVDGQD